MDGNVCKILSLDGGGAKGFDLPPETSLVLM